MKSHRRSSWGAVFSISAFLFEEKDVFISGCWGAKQVFCEPLKDLFSGCTESCQKMRKEVLDIKV